MHDITLSGEAGLRERAPTRLIWAAAWIARVLVVTAPERLFGSRPGGNKPWLV
jgi:hypothetical protein